MVLWTDFYPAWFLDSHSEKACEQMKLRVIPAGDWIDSLLAPEFILPHDFELFSYARKNRVHILVFKPKIPGYDKILIHPDSFLKLTKRCLNKLLKQQDSNTSNLKIFIYGNRTVH